MPVSATASASAPAPAAPAPGASWAKELDTADLHDDARDDAPFDDAGDSAPRRRGPSWLLVIAIILAVAALLTGAALGRFGNLGFGSRAGDKSSRRATPDAPRVAQGGNIEDHSASMAAARSQITVTDTSRVAANAAPDTSTRPAIAAAETSITAPPRSKPSPVGANAAPAPARTRELATPDASGPEVWGVHVSSFPHREMAVRDSVAWRKKGYVVHVVAKDIPEKGLWYRIVLGEFAAKAEAQAFAEDVRAREGLDYGLVMKVPAR